MTDTLAGKLLLASPGMDDPNFNRAVILLVEHHDEGALGLVINRPTETMVDEVWDQISALPCPVDAALRRGGPCPGPLMLLHDRKAHAQAEVCRGVCFSTDAELVTEVLTAGADRLGFYLGYAGWGPGQLEDELSQGAWLITQATPEIVFDPDADDGLWMRAITQIDRSLAMLAMNPKIMPHDPSMN